jgi:hypothetical protein
MDVVNKNNCRVFVKALKREIVVIAVEMSSEVDTITVISELSCCDITASLQLYYRYIIAMR